MILFSSWQGEIVDNRGVKRAKKPKAIALPEEFKPGEKIKAFFGWDGIVICDDSVDLIDMALNYAEAMLKESCGKCTPCGQGSRFMRGFLEKLAKGEATKDDLNALWLTFQGNHA
jgi:formate dehydrogenase beta subunit